MIAGTFGRADGPGLAPEQAVPAGSVRRAGALHVAWTGPVEVHEADGLLVVLDGFLVGPGAGLDRVAAAWRRSGTASIADLRGAFTVLVWDEAGRRGVLACDQFSLRPCLMHGSNGAGLRFSTHLPTLRRMMPTDAAPEPGVLVPWIAPQYLQDRRTMLAGVERVGAAHLVELGDDGWARRRYWRPEWRGTLDASFDELTHLLRSELRRSLGERLGAAGPAGVILSGGVDSSVVLAAAADLHPRPSLRAYSTVFPSWPAADESARIDATTRFVGVPGARFAIRPQGALRLALEQLRDAGTVPGGPGGLVERPGVVQAAEDGVGVLLDGQGGDELFGRSPYLLADRLRRGDLRGVSQLLRRTVPHLRRRRSLANAAWFVREFGVRPAVPRRLAAPRAARQAPPWLTRASAAVLAETHDPWPWWRDDPVPRWWAYHSYLLSDHVEGSGLGEHLWERGAPFGLRSAAPLFDVGLVELVLTFPPEALWQRPDRPVARATVEGLLPEEVRTNRGKANIGPFYLDVVTGPDNAVIRELLLSPRARVREFADASWLEHHLRRLPTRKEADWLSWTTVVWRLAMAECWLRWLEDPEFPAQLLDRDDLPRVDASRVGYGSDL